jgi:Ca2+-binding EF-hand superfamily protein
MFDPAAFFDRLSEGRDTVDLGNLPPQFQRMGDRFMSTAQQMGLDTRRISRDQFASMMEESMRQRGGPGGPGGPRGGPGAPGGSSANRDAYDEERAKASFQRMDKNGDGVITPSEASDTLKAEFEKWDANKNGVIDFDEYKEYYKARMKYLRGDSEDRPRDTEALQRAIQDAQEQELERRPTVYHSGNLPRELPAWFVQLDRDKDGQVALYEWKQAGYAIDEFLKWDANGDGFITVEEALRYMHANNMHNDQGGTTPTDGTQIQNPTGTPSIPGPVGPGNGMRGPRGPGGPGGPGGNRGQGGMGRQRGGPPGGSQGGIPQGGFQGRGNRTPRN